MKVCSKCKIEKPRDEFYTCRRYLDGLTNDCKECRRAASRAQKPPKPKVVVKDYTYYLQQAGMVDYYNRLRGSRCLAD